ncbi:Hexuronate transporter [Hondaea fermentalgiana]|uniref:Hexuronate transporter n=1 Tax=Hondaea fermentalgiana TaxID=2315210 RepID=A0A2R5G269_9STRA|nr:Hexuronate transporter [Hondaea fermentalgiana]|eukprot:GBG25100.1 Hexuronate transporter [Hondaea fermentalgiana]
MPVDSRAKRVGLALLLLVYTCNQWSRYSIVFLGGVATPECPARTSEDVCAVKEVPLCPEFQCVSEECRACQSCLDDAGTEHFNLKYAACISSTQYGILAGYGYMVIFCVTGLAAGRAADLYNRKHVIAAAAAGWALFTALQGLSSNFGVLLLSRVGMAFCQAFSSPPSLSLIADLFPSDERAQANGIYSFGIYLGNGLSSLSLVMAQLFGWRAASLVIGFASMLSSLLLAVFVSEPRFDATAAPAAVAATVSTSSEQASVSGSNHGAQTPLLQDHDHHREGESHADAGEHDEECELPPPPPVTQGKAMSLGATLSIIVSDRPTLFLFIAAPLRFLGGFAVGAFLPQYFNRRFPSYSSQYSTLNAILLSVAGASSAYLGGFLSDRWRRTDPRGAAWVPAIAGACGFIPFLGVLFADNFYLAMFSLMLEYLIAEGWFGPAISILQSRLPGTVRGTSISIYMFVAGLVGSLAPSALGKLDDGVSWTGLRFYLALFVGVSYLGSSLAFIAVACVLHDPAPIDSHASLRRHDS